MSMRYWVLAFSLLGLAAGGCAAGFVDGRVGGLFPQTIHGARPGLGTEWHFGGRLGSNVAIHAGAGIYYVQGVPTGCRPGSGSSCTGPSGQFDSDTGGAYVAPLMGGVKLMHQWGGFTPFIRGESGILYTEYSHGLEQEHASAVAYRLGTGFLIGEGRRGGFGIEGGLLRSRNMTYTKTVTKAYDFSGFTLGLTSTW
jgi:hypothetical protein